MASIKFPPKKLGEPVITLLHLCKEYVIPGSDEKITAIKDLHLDTDTEFKPIHRGEFIMLRGPSGGGKTTLLNLLGTLDMATSGSIVLLGKQINEKSSDRYLSDLRLKRIGFVFQTFNLLSALSAFENVMLPMTLLNQGSASQRIEKTHALLNMVGLQDRVMHLPSELSGGEQQRVAIARALANDPELLLLDEPTGDLDSKNTVEIMDLLLRINLDRRTTCVMVTHNPDVECYADRLLFIENGVLLKQVYNLLQMPLVYEDYMAYLKKKEE
ncbi:ABC transporter H member 2 [Coelomomyces lativittatus]|nr:ABC transporter H member 2 [Coelomomyces lativittatus]KAJ1514517.1 ABC transporter H member 2 [Coelomomyces lativittatus]KAJ1517543.1 ABC transporter H member 2 [Coelomomyces lativittatus]